MKTLLLAAVAAFAIAGVAAPAAAQADSHYTQGPLWYVTGVHVEDGQFENYMDYLAKEFKKENEFGIKEGVNLSYHVLVNTAKRANEPDLYLSRHVEGLPDDRPAGGVRTQAQQAVGGGSPGSRGGGGQARPDAQDRRADRISRADPQVARRRTACPTPSSSP